MPGGFDHGPWGADVSLADLNLCAQTLDGIRNHSWSRPAPSTVEGEIVSWADRIAYCAHDLEDAVHAGIVRADEIPDAVADVAGRTRREQLGHFVRAVVAGVAEHGEVGHVGGLGGGARRRCGRSTTSGSTSGPSRWPSRGRWWRCCRRSSSTSPPTPRPCPTPWSRTDDPVRTAVTYVAGMTDRFAFDLAVRDLGWDPGPAAPAPGRVKEGT